MKMKGPKDAVGVSFGGKWYGAARGVVDVPVEAFAELGSHGFKALSDADAGSAKPDGNEVLS